jgi:hypothetical protein
MTTETPPDWSLAMARSEMGFDIAAGSLAIDPIAAEGLPENDNEAVLIKARELAIENMRPGLVVERAILNGAYDKGTMITRWIPEAEKFVLANREEAVDE